MKTDATGSFLERLARQAQHRDDASPPDDPLPFLPSPFVWPSLAALSALPSSCAACDVCASCTSGGGPPLKFERQVRDEQRVYCDGTAAEARRR